MPPDIDRGHPVARRDQQRNEVPVGVAVLSHAVREDHQRPLPVHLVRDPATVALNKAIRHSQEANGIS
ncbi:hypothetical protein GCM10011608_15360 [Micromonospora sonchi]|uniref:Uncharacterized protein n=1 Tax=Micromonospora sonchi TaxID=1763543 RepID=A0A917TPD9_9ACTN|nr:hypothetical protein GCM10011608_15360 [Micromonospora sonchi]